MSRRKRPLHTTSEEDALLFREAIGDVRPLPATDAPPPRAPRPEPEPAQFRADEARVRDELLASDPDHAGLEMGDELRYLKPGQPQRLLQRLRRGHYSVRAEIDLHEMSSAVAREAVRLFLDDCLRHGETCVRIVHGKGLRSPRGPVLKHMVDGLLRRRADVLAFTSARPVDGGTGAVLVLLGAPARACTPPGVGGSPARR